MGTVRVEWLVEGGSTSPLRLVYIPGVRHAVFVTP